MGGQSRSCEEPAKLLKRCLMETECAKSGKRLRECFQESPECDALRYAYSACKRSQVDMRTRIQGIKGN